MMVSFLKEVLVGNLTVSERVDPDLFIINYNDTELDRQLLNLTQWYISPEYQTFEQLITAGKDKNLIELITLFPIFRGILYDDFANSEGFYNAVYYAKKEERMILEYPASPTKVYRDWAQTEDLCPDYFPSGRHEFYDAR